MSNSTAKTRPSDLVMEYLHSKLSLRTLPPGARLPAAVELATELGISQGTVKNVYRRLATEGKVRMRSGDGSFWLGEHEEEPAKVLHIGVDVAERRPEEPSTTRWSHRLYGGMMEEKLSMPAGVQFHTCENLRFHEDGTLKQPVPLLESLDGVLLIALTRHPLDSLTVGGRKIPCVALNPYYEDAVSNFVSPDYFTASYRLGRVWRELGYRRIVALMSPGMDDSVSVRLRYGGLLSGANPGAKDGMDIRLLTVPVGTEAHGQEAIASLLKDEKWVPQAIYAAGDLLAFGAVNALEEHGLEVPGDVSVVGGNGADFLKYPPRILSCMEHGLENIGKKMLQLLLRRIELNGGDVPAHIEPSRFFTGTTTSEAENALLGASPIHR